MKSFIGVALPFVCFLVAEACVGDSSVPPSDSGIDGTTDVTTADVVKDGPSEAESGPSVTYNDMAASNVWATVDVSPQSGSTSFAGSAFDGRYLYLSPVSGSKALRLDTKSSSFTTAASPQWDVFDLTTLTPAGTSYFGAVFAGKYVYYVPTYDVSSKAILARYDTTSTSFQTGWVTLDLSTVGMDAIYLGGVYDGSRYVYLVGNSNYTGSPITRFARLDTTGTLGSTSSWLAIDPTMLIDPNAWGYKGGAFDGRYVYYIPRNTGGMPGGLAVRYDTQSTFTQAGSWSKYDLVPNVNANAKGFAGAAFDGRYLYMMPEVGTNFVARFDTQQPFAVSGSWSTFNVSSVNTNASGFAGTVYDGRYVYLVPEDNGTPNGFVTRYDTTAAFGSTMSWQTFDIASINSAAVGFYGGGFDGRYVYFVPAYKTTVARFDSRSPAGLPPALGSFL